MNKIRRRAKWHIYTDTYTQNKKARDGFGGKGQNRQIERAFRNRPAPSFLKGDLEVHEPQKCLVSKHLGQ